MRDCVHHLPKLNDARRRVRPCGRLVHLAFRILVEDKSRAESAVAKNSRSGDGHGSVDADDGKESFAAVAAVHKSNSLRQKTTKCIPKQLASFCYKSRTECCY